MLNHRAVLRIGAVLYFTGKNVTAISADQNNFCNFIFKHENLKREDAILDSPILFSNITLDNQLNSFHGYIMSWRFLSRDG